MYYTNAVTARTYCRTAVNLFNGREVLAFRWN